MHQGKGSADLSQQSGRGKKSLGSESSGPGDHWGMQDEEEVGAENEPEEEMVGSHGEGAHRGTVTDLRITVFQTCWVFIGLTCLLDIFASNS